MNPNPIMREAKGVDIGGIIFYEAQYVNGAIRDWENEILL